MSGMSKIKSGYVAIIGKPNVGKSTLMNQLLGERLSIISSKPQTTRKRILGILNSKDYQVIFLDTPGILTPNYMLQEKFLDYVRLSVRDADIIIVMIDMGNDKNGANTLSDEIVSKVLSNPKQKKVAVLNKADLSDEAEIKTLIEKLETMKTFDSVIPISAKENYNTDAVTDTIIKLLPVGPRYYPEDQLTDEPERFFVTEIIREKIFELYRDEIPFSTEVEIEDFKEREKGKDYVSASIIVEKQTQKGIIIGNKGEMVKRVGEMAREAIELFLQRPVFLELHVKVKSKWRSNPQMLRRFGYDLPKE
jgi:GTP-binding protein Era